MAESGEGISASVNSKEKKSLLDEEIGTDFLSSWKSMSVTEVDAMDFSFDAVPNGKKKFNFDKLDMDFNLDSDFDKFASFKVDMPDLDFSSPSKTKTKTEERANEDSTSGEHQGKKGHHFNFSFDFNNEDFASDAQTGSKLVGNSKLVTRDLIEDEPILLISEMKVKNPRNIRGSFNSDDTQNGSKLVGNLRLQDKQVTEGEPAIAGSEKNAGEDIDASDVQIRSNLVGDSKPLTRELTDDEPGLLGSENNVKNFSDIREGIESDGVQSESNLAVDARPEEKQVSIEKSIIPEREKSIKEDFNINDAQITNNLLSSKSLSREMTTNEPVSLGSEKDVKSVSNIREGIDADAVQNGSKIVVKSRLQDKEVTTGEPIMLKSEKISGNFQGNPSCSTEKMSKSNTEACGNPEFMVSSMQSVLNVKIDSVEGLKTGKRPIDLSSLKVLRTIRSKKEVTNSKVLRQSNSSRNLEQNMELLGNMRSNIAHPIGGTEKRKPLTPSLKRKKIEESNAELVSLKPLKRLSESPKESRNFKESSSGRVIKEEVCNNENRRQSKTKNVLNDHSTPGLEVSREIIMNELEISVVLENDGNVEKAEAFTKELEDICNMLKKKHEEAKEILVRAIVNNNNLLMLNHPINEEKIRMVQKFATQLTLKEVQT